MGNPDIKIKEQDGITPEMAEEMAKLIKKDEEMNLIMGFGGEKRKRFIVKTTKERGSGPVIEENINDQREKDYKDFRIRRAKELGKPIDRLEKYSKLKIASDNYSDRKEKKENGESSIEEIAEILKNNKIDQIIIAGEKGPDPEVLKKNPEFTEKIFNLKPDLDAYTALYILNNFNKKTPEETFSETSVISVIEKNGDGKDLIGEEKKGIIIYLDTGGKWPTIKIEKDGETKILYIDHHGHGKREPTSGTKMTLEIMKKAEILEDIPPWFKKFTTFVNDIDNLSYIEGKDDKDRKIFIENYFRNEWPNSLYALAEKKIPFKTLIELCESGKIKDPSKPFTTEELNGELGSFKIGEFTIKELCEQQRGEVKDVLENGIKNRIKNNKKQGLNLNSKILGKIVYQDYSKNYGKIDMIPNHLAFKATKAKGFDTYISWNKQKKIFYINSFNPNLSKIVEELNKVDPECAIDVRGVMVYGKIKNLTEEQFLDIIDPNILKNSKLNNKELKQEQNNETWTKKNEERYSKAQEIIEIEKDKIEKAKVRLAEIDARLVELDNLEKELMENMTGN